MPYFGYLLFSGGLDSILAARVLQEQNIKVTGVTLVSNFFDAEKARESAQKIGIDLEEVDISREMIEIVKDPAHGHGKNLNPCIDCHMFMLKKLKEKFLDKCEDGCFAATGEVLGQRPFSQNKEALTEVAKAAGIEVLRPLSAKNLPPTSMEEKGWVDRSKLLDIQGRSRNRQKELARKYRIKDHPSPAGGCLLTDLQFSQRLGEMMKRWPGATPEDVELLKYGRIFWANFLDKKWVLMVVARDQKEAEKLKQLARAGDVVVELSETTGPLTLVRELKTETDQKKQKLEVYIPEDWPYNLLTPPQRKDQLLETAALVTGYYKPVARGGEVKVEINKI